MGARSSCIEVHVNLHKKNIYIYIYINIGSRKKTTLSSRQARFVIAHSSGDFNDKNIHSHRLYTLRLHCGENLNLNF